MRNRRKKSGRLPPFVAVTWEMLNSKAYKDLSFSASKLLTYFLGKPKMNQANPEYYEVLFEFTYREAKNYGFSSKTFSRCIDELIEKGFIEPIWKGGLRGDGKSASKFRISKRWLNYGESDFKQIGWRQFITANAF